MIFRQIWRQINVDLFLIDWEKPKQHSSSSDHSNNVSVWRKLFVANEWNELATTRHVNAELVLLELLFLLRGINLEYLATSQPSSSLGSRTAAIDIILRFAITSALIMALSTCQMVYRHLLHHRFFAHDVVQFVDFMTMSNIRLFSTHQNHIFYIHQIAVPLF